MLARKLIVPVHHALEVLQPASGVIDGATTLVAFPVVAHGALAVCSAGNDRHGFGLAQQAAERVDVLALLGDYVEGTAHAGEQLERFHSKL